jgi:hypothetical protein
MSVKDDIRLNPNELDKQWADLADQFHNYSEEGDLIESEIKFKKLELELLEADLDLKIRNKPADFNIDKLTESGVKSSIRMNQIWRDLNYEILELEKQRKLMASACRALEMKKEALKSIQALYLSEFYIAPSAPEEEKKFKNHQEELVARNIRLEMKKHAKRKGKSSE